MSPLRGFDSFGIYILQSYRTYGAPEKLRCDRRRSGLEAQNAGDARGVGRGLGGRHTVVRDFGGGKRTMAAGTDHAAGGEGGGPNVLLQGGESFLSTGKIGRFQGAADGLQIATCLGPRGKEAGRTGLRLGGLDILQKGGEGGLCALEVAGAKGVLQRVKILAALADGGKGGYIHKLMRNNNVSRIYRREGGNALAPRPKSGLLDELGGGKLCQHAFTNAAHRAILLLKCQL